MKRFWLIAGMGHHWRWWVLYIVPLVPLYFLDNWLLRGRVWYWVVWGVAIFTALNTASRLERYWPKREKAGTDGTG